MPSKRKRTAAAAAEPAKKKATRSTRGSARASARKTTRSTRSSRRGKKVEEDEEDESDEDDEAEPEKEAPKATTRKKKREVAASKKSPAKKATSTRSRAKPTPPPEPEEGEDDEDDEDVEMEAPNSAAADDVDEGLTGEDDSEEEDGSSEDGEDSASSEDDDEPVQRRLPTRGSRGKRFSQLVGEELEADQEFWGQKAWADDADDDYVFEKQKDIVDSDFDKSESEGEDGEAELQKRSRKGKGGKRGKVGKYQDPAFVRRKKAKGATRKRVAGKAHAVPNVARQRVFRASTAATSKLAKAVRAQQSAIAMARVAARAAKSSTAKPLDQMTQDQLLEAASYTEIENKRKLEVMLQMQMDSRERAAPKAPYSGPVVRYRSSLDSGTTYTFTEVNVIPSIINAKPKPYPKKPVCAITGMSAKYRDPKTGLYYATLEAFKVIRERAAAADP
jgi:vacuolar protein sorting-associated protein 72